MNEATRTPLLAALPSEAAFHRSLETALLAPGEGTGERPGTVGSTPAAGGSDALGKQVGGDHYKSFAIQPVEYIHGNGLDYLAGNVVKYVSRHKAKNGAADIRKAIHYCELILSLQYGEDA